MLISSVFFFVLWCQIFQNWSYLDLFSCKQAWQFVGRTCWIDPLVICILASIDDSPAVVENYSALVQSRNGVEEVEGAQIPLKLAVKCHNILFFFPAFVDILICKPHIYQ